MCGKKFVFWKWSYVGQLILSVLVTEEFQLLLLSVVMNGSDILYLMVVKNQNMTVQALLFLYILSLSLK